MNIQLTKVKFYSVISLMKLILIFIIIILEEYLEYHLENKDK